MLNNGLAYAQMLTALRADVPVNIDNDTANYINTELRGKSVHDNATGKTYTILVDEVEEFEKLTISSTLNTKIRFLMPSSVSSQFGTTTKYVDDSTLQNNNIQITYHVKKYKIRLQEAYGVQTAVPRDDSSTTVYRAHLEDAPYDMFAIPYSDQMTIKVGATTMTPNIQAGMGIANGFITTLGDAKVYDIQILPYCPVRQFIKEDNGSYILDITAADSTQVKPIVDSADQTSILNYVFYCSTSQLENVKLRNNQGQVYEVPITDYKKSSNLDTWRLCSPNFASIFEFNAAKNGGVDYFEFSINYKPYNPYVKIRPHFGKLYGTDEFIDARGLILQGDFSIPSMSSAWTNYELQNKNYLNTFNREIESLELQDEIEGRRDIWNTLSGTVQGAATGAIGGAMVGGVYGAVAGGIVGGVSSMLGGIQDRYDNARLRNDAISKAKTLFNYNLQNIKALPHTIRNVGCLTADNLLVPVLEYYTASDSETELFNYKMKYYGMTVNTVGRIDQYVDWTAEETFVQGYLLRLEPGLGDILEEADNHLAQELSAEVQKGLYIIGGNS